VSRSDSRGSSYQLGAPDNTHAASLPCAQIVHFWVGRLASEVLIACYEWASAFGLASGLTQIIRFGMIPGIHERTVC
jgi:hypothetical protein